MTRLSNWDGRLADYLAKVASRSYEPSQHDCLLYPAGAVKAVTGRDYGRGHRGKYSTTKEAYLYLRKLGAETPEEYLDSLFPEKSVGFAQRGDLVLVDMEGQRNPGVCIGGDALVIAAPEDGSPDRLQRVPRGLWIKAWAIE